METETTIETETKKRAPQVPYRFRRPMSDRRYLTRTDFFAYSGMGKTRGMKWAEEIGAVRRVGRRVLIDRLVVDKAMEAVGTHSGGAD